MKAVARDRPTFHLQDLHILVSMVSQSTIKRCIVRVSIVAIFLATVPKTHGEEPAEKFLEELRNRGYYDMAVEYLETLRTSPLATSDFKETIDYEQATTLIQGIQLQREFKAKEQQLRDAERKLSSFLKEQANHPLKYAAQTQMAKILVERALLRMARAELSSVPEEQQAKLKLEAISFFDQSIKIFARNKDELQKQIEAIPKALDPETDLEMIKRRAQLRNDYVFVQYQAARIQYEKAMLLEAGSDERKVTIEAAFEKFAVIADKYRRRFFGIESVYYMGVCKQELGNLKEALTFYTELQEQSGNDADIRRVKTRALSRAIECWINPEVDLLDEAILRGSEWIDQQRPNERRSADWLELKLALAKAYKSKADLVSGKEQQDLIAAMRKLANQVAKTRGPTQRPAQELLIAVGQVDRSQEERVQPKTFLEASDLIRDLNSELQTATASVKLLSDRLPKVSAANERTAIEEMMSQTAARQQVLRKRLIELNRLAIRLAGDEVEYDKINVMRYTLCYLYYLVEDDYRTSVLGQFLGERYPDATGSRQAARLALAALARIDQEAKHQDEGIQQRINRVAEMILNRWPETDESEYAISTLISFSIRDSDIDKAEELLARIPESSDVRGDKELATGQAIWKQYLDRRKEERAAGKSQDSADVLSLKSRALGLLQKGIERKRADGISSSLLRAMLSLAQSYVDAREYSEALKLLDDPQSGPHTLAKERSTLMQSPGMSEKAFLLAIQSYIGSLGRKSDPEQRIRDALQSMDALKRTLGDSEQGKKALVTEYVLLAQQIQSQLDDATTQARSAMAQGFEQILVRIADSANDTAILTWTAQALAKVGSNTRTAKGDVSADGIRLLAKSIELFESVLKDESISEKQAKAISFQIAVARRDMGEFKRAIDEFERLLSNDEMQLYVQMEAARTYQQWGSTNKDAYLRAIVGDRMMPLKRRNLIWGWGKLSQQLGRDKRFRELFHECRYNLARCRYLYAKSSGSDQRAKALNLAKNDVLMTSRFYPKLGGDDRRNQYDQLLKQIQTALGEKAVGLASNK